jgi:hypothetical protein
MLACYNASTIILSTIPLGLGNDNESAIHMSLLDMVMPIRQNGKKFGDCTGDEVTAVGQILTAMGTDSDDPSISEQTGEFLNTLAAVMRELVAGKTRSPICLDELDRIRREHRRERI